MSILFDTSVLVAAMVAAHPDHLPALSWLTRVQAKAVTGVICAHTLAEAYAVLTSLPLQPRIPPDLARDLLRENLAAFRMVSLSAKDYQATLARVSRLQLSGGGVYDALIAQAALKAKCATLLTLNPKHFTRLGDPIAALVRTP